MQTTTRAARWSSFSAPTQRPLLQRMQRATPRSCLPPIHACPPFTPTFTPTFTPAFTPTFTPPAKAVAATPSPPSPPPAELDWSCSASSIDVAAVAAASGVADAQLDGLEKSPLGSSWGGSCYARVAFPSVRADPAAYASQTELAANSATQQTCEAACGAMPGGHVFCPDNDDELSYVQDNCLFLGDDPTEPRCNPGVRIYWTSLKQHLMGLQYGSMEPGRKWWYDPARGCSGGVVRFGTSRTGDPAFTFPNNNSRGQIGAMGYGEIAPVLPHSCSNLVLGTAFDAALYWPQQPFMMDTSCSDPFTDWANVPTQCVCEFAGEYPPPASPPPPPSPPDPPPPPSPPPYGPLHRQYGGPGNPTVIGASIGVCITVTLLVIVPAFALFVKFVLPKLAVQRAQKNRVMPEDV